MNSINSGNDIHVLNRIRRIRYILVVAVMLCLFAVITVLNISIGSMRIPVEKIIDILLHKNGDEAFVNIIWQIRIPRILMAAILGGALSLSGFLLQTFFHNPIAGPFILGISSGAKMTIAIAMIIFIKKVGNVSSYMLVLAAFVGAMMSIAFVLLLSKRVNNMSVLLVGGIMISYICSAITDFLITFADDADIVNLHGWSLGSFSGMDFADVKVAFIIVFIAFIIVYLMAKPISAYQLGEAYAKSLGVNIRVFRACLIILSGILSATVTAFAGPVSFVGIAVPHLVKRMLSTSDPRIVIPVSFLGGSVFCMFCDLIARTVFAPTELNISTVTAVFGAPVVIIMLLKNKQRRQ